MAAIAQLVARRSHNPKVVSSTLTRRIFPKCALPMNIPTCTDWPAKPPEGNALPVSILAHAEQTSKKSASITYRATQENTQQMLQDPKAPRRGAPERNAEPMTNWFGFALQSKNSELETPWHAILSFLIRLENIPSN
jgi:hypothetical protein